MQYTHAVTAAAEFLALNSCRTYYQRGLS